MQLSTSAAAESNRIDHYEAMRPASAAEATAIMQKHVAQIDRILNHGRTLNHQQYETIHQLSYSLEAAIDVLMQQPTKEPFSDRATRQAVEALHLASEQQEEASLRAAFTSLQSSWPSVADGHARNE